MYVLMMCNWCMIWWCITWWSSVSVFVNDDQRCYNCLINYSCIPTKCYDVYSHPFIVVVFMVSVLVGYWYSGWGALVAGHLEGGDADLFSLLSFSDFTWSKKHVLWSVTLGLGSNVECLFLWSLSLVKLYVISTINAENQILSFMRNVELISPVEIWRVIIL
jgi:hypothetical protein